MATLMTQRSGKTPEVISWRRSILSNLLLSSHASMFNAQTIIKFEQLSEICLLKAFYIQEPFNNIGGEMIHHTLRILLRTFN